MASEEFIELVERTRQATSDICEKAKLVLRPLLPGVEALQKDNTHFSPRLMLLMVSRTGDQMSPSDRHRLNGILQYVEAFQPQLHAWMDAVKDNRASAGSSVDSEECSRALELMSQHLADLDQLLVKVSDG